MQDHLKIFRLQAFLFSVWILVIGLISSLLNLLWDVTLYHVVSDGKQSHFWRQIQLMPYYLVHFAFRSLALVTFFIYWKASLENNLLHITLVLTATIPLFQDPIYSTINVKGQSEPLLVEYTTNTNITDSNSRNSLEITTYVPFTITIIFNATFLKKNTFYKFLSFLSQEWAILTIVPLASFNMWLTRHTYQLPWQADEQQHLWFCTVVGGI